MKRHTYTMTQTQIDQWNATFKVGHPCTLRLDNGEEMQTRTRSPAWLIAADRRGRAIPVVAVEGKAGGWALDRVRMMETHTP